MLLQRPIEAESLRLLQKRDKKYYYALRRNVTHILKKELDYVVNAPFETNIIIQVFGIQGGGKSTVAGSLALKLRNKFRKKGLDSRIFLGFSNSEILSYLPETKYSDVLFRDEGTAEEGEESNLVRKELKNIIKAIREGGRNIIFVDPEQDVPSHLCTLLLEPIGIDVQNKRNLVLVHDRLGNPLGYAWIKVEEDKEFWKYYRKRKRENLQDLIERGGKKTVQKDRSKLKEDADRVVEEIESQGYVTFIKNVYDIFPFLDMLGISGSTYYVQRVANLALLQIRALQQQMKEAKQQGMEMVDIPKNNVDGLELIREEDDEQFFDLILEKLRKYVSDEDVRIFADWLTSGDPQWKIGKRYGYKQSTISTKITNVRENGLGYAAEDAFLQVLKQNFENIEHYGGNSPYPDFIVHDIRSVISFKCYINPKWNISYAKKNLGAAEKQYAQTHNYDLLLVIYNMALKKFRWYRVTDF